MRRTISRSLLAAVATGALVAAGTSGTAVASKCTSAASQVRISKRQLKRDKAALRHATTVLRKHPRSASAKRTLARARLRVRADNRVLANRKHKYEQICLPGY